MTQKYQIYSTTIKAWEAMYNALKEAKFSVYCEMFIFLDDSVGKKFYDLLEEKAKAGLQIKVIIDLYGSWKLLNNSRIDNLRLMGVDIIFFQDKKSRIPWLTKLRRRNHSKVLIIDYQIAFLGGVNVGESMAHWLDVQVQISGPEVGYLLKSFARSYIIAGGDKQKVKNILFYNKSFSEEIFFISSRPKLHTSCLRKKYTEIMLKARQKIVIFSPYFFPDWHLIRTIRNLIKRKVQIELVVPKKTDIFFITEASRIVFSFLHRLGVKIYLLNKMMHGKGMVVDEEIAIVGSGNFDFTSFYYNYESNVKIKDPFFAGKLHGILEEWKKNSL